VVYEGKYWEVILPFKDVGDLGRIIVPRGKNYLGIEATFLKVSWEKGG